MRLSTTSRSNGRSSSSRCASRALAASTTSWPSSRRARPSALRIFSSSSTSRMEPRMASRASCAGAGCGAASGRSAARCGSRCPRRGGSSTVMVPPSASTMFFAMASPRPVPVALGREVRLEDVRQIRRARCRCRGRSRAMSDLATSSRRRRLTSRSAASGRPDRDAPDRACSAWRPPRAARWPGC